MPDPTLKPALDPAEWIVTSPEDPRVWILVSSVEEGSRSIDDRKQLLQVDHIERIQEYAHDYEHPQAGLMSVPGTLFHMQSGDRVATLYTYTRIITEILNLSWPFDATDGLDNRIYEPRT